ncbi:hypothetical protein LOK49_LG01G00179 [Camellia lanceoleosa]|uniref:Uncharacterized protein n=1 Tax=Camellia lanceoleosa TaxID=1840588 RepID=A0ACC0IWJ7_9ERIC|nr:hypothetical protein LOK49_LG01G00179 [Camellia lanceoleosa]
MERIILTTNNIIIGGRIKERPYSHTNQKLEILKNSMVTQNFGTFSFIVKA